MFPFIIMLVVTAACGFFWYQAKQNQVRLEDSEGTNIWSIATIFSGIVTLALGLVQWL